jgi:hypothetical protein
MTATYDSIASTTLTTNQSSITFSSISSSYTDLYLVAFARTTRASVTDLLRLGFNGDTSASNYSATFLASDTSQGTAYSGRYVRGDYYGPIFPAITAANETANVFGVVLVHINNYSNTTTNKTYLARGNYKVDLGATVGLWNNTNAISSIVISGAFGDLVTGTTLSLYGIRAA